LDIDTAYKLARDGDSTARENLFRILSVRLRLIANYRIWDTDDCEDVVQDTLMVISKEYSQLEIESSFTAWCRKVLHNRILNYLKKKQTRELNMTTGFDLADQTAAIGEDLDFKSTLMNCLGKVMENNPKYARILNFYYQGYSTEEICSRLNLTTGHFYVMLSRARSMLAYCLEKGEVK